MLYGENRKEISGYNPETTNNIMEITAVLEAVKLLKFPCEITIYSDSAYVVNCFEKGWIYNWQKNNWQTADKKPVKNKAPKNKKHAPKAPKRAAGASCVMYGRRFSLYDCRRAKRLL